MNPEKIMILVNGKDQTEKIREVYDDFKHKKLIIIYKDSPTKFSYNYSRAHKLENPKQIDLNKYIAFVSGQKICNPQSILDFGEKIRVVENDESIKIIDSQQFELIEKSTNSQQATQILSYLKDISKYIRNKNEDSKNNSTPFLESQMNNLTFVHPKSVLYSYLNHCAPVKNSDINMDGIIFPFRFNLSQKKALENALSSSISVIEGPPGTGKTQTILNIIANLIVQRKSIAVVSNNNGAIKNVAEKMEKRGYGFLTAMLGNKENQKLFFSHLPVPETDGWYCEETLAELCSQIISLNYRLNELLQIEQKKARLKQKLSAWQTEQAYYEAYYAKQEVEKIDKFPLFESSPEQIIDFLAETSCVQELQNYKKFIHKLRLLFKYGIVSQIKLQQHETSIVLTLERLYYEKQIDILNKKIASCENELQNANFEKLLERHQLLSEKLFKKYLYQNYKTSTTPHFTKDTYKKNFQAFIHYFPVILSTTHSLRSSIPNHFLLDYVIIDESSQVDLITGVLALSCCRNVIIVGDTKQLPQITNIKLKEKLVTETPHSAYDYFQHNILSSVIQLYGSNLPMEILREHYRCHPQIIEFCNQKYYNGELIPYTDFDSSVPPLILIKTAKGNHMRYVTEGNETGIYNQRELDVIIQELLNSPEYTKDRENIGIVTPYRKQANMAQQQTDKSIESDTVHKYQGREKDVMIMSTVLTNNKSSNALEFVDDPHMINVAVSRAIRQFILVTDYDLFYKKGKDIGDLIRYIQYNTLDKNVIESKIVSIFDLLYRSYSNKLIQYKSKMNPQAQFQSEEALRVLLEEIFHDREFCQLSYAQGMLLQNLLNDTALLNTEELKFVNNRASLDFVIYYKQGKNFLCVIEVDGFAFHKNKPVQLKRDQLKDGILKKYEIPILRLPTNGSQEKEKIQKMLKDIM